MARKTLGKYEVIERLGRGGMAEVYKGYHAALDRYVAIKLLHPFLADDPEFKDRFEKEARNVAKLRHPNIVQVFDFEYDQHGESYYMVMELINGPTLKDKLFELAANDQRYSLEESVRIISDTTNALSYAHKRSMIHRDVKPANLMLDEDGRIVLTDFGIAKIVTGVQFTASGGMVGTPAYMAPEQGLGEAGDERSDLYSVGIIMYQMVTGRLPYDADTPLAIILKHLNEPMPDIRKVEPGLPDWAVQVTTKAMEKDPDKRYQSAEEFLEDLRRGLGGRVLLGDTKSSNSVFITDPADSVFATNSKPLTVINEATEQDKRRVTGSNRTVLDPNRVRSNQAPNPPTQTPRTMTTGGARNLNTSTGRAKLPELTPVKEKNRGCTSVAITVLLMLVLLGTILGLIITGQNGNGPLAAFFDNKDTKTATTQIAANSSATLPLLPTGEPTNTPTASNTPTPSKTSSPTNTPTATATATATATETFTPSPSPTITASTTASSTPTVTPLPTSAIGATQTARVQTATASTPTLTAEEALVRCDLDYAILEPRELDKAPSLRDTVNPRLVQAGTEFTFDLVIENASTCDWPTEGGLEFFFLKDTTPLEIDYGPLTRECSSQDRIFEDINYTSPTRPRIFLEGPVLRGNSLTITITGLAADQFGCYFGVWQLQFADFSLPIGDPIIMPIQVFGGQ